MTPLQHLHQAIEPLRRQLLEHSLYGQIDSLAAVRGFMERHVFAVWDFMSLLKALQRALTGVDVPWTPPRDPIACRLINEIVLGEESDEDGRGGYASHFELYRAAMQEAGAETRTVDRFLESLAAGDSVTTALPACGAEAAVVAFVETTFGVLQSGRLPAIAAAFTFGREDLLPDVFRQIVERIDREADGRLGMFRYYLDRHIELDEDRHGPMAERLIATLCGDDPAAWQEAEQAAVASLRARIVLWDAIAAAVGELPANVGPR